MCSSGGTADTKVQDAFPESETISEPHARVPPAAPLVAVVIAKALPNLTGTPRRVPSPPKSSKRHEAGAMEATCARKVAWKFFEGRAAQHGPHRSVSATNLGIQPLASQEIAPLFPKKPQSSVALIQAMRSCARLLEGHLLKKHPTRSTPYLA